MRGQQESPLLFVEVMISEQTIKSLVESHLKDSGLFLVDLNVLPGNKIRIFIDGDDGITINQCRELSKYIESNLDREHEDFELEVSSPGIGKPLKIERQYKKNIGRRLRIKTINGKILTGKLLSADSEKIEIESESKDKKTKKISLQRLTLAYPQIKEAVIEITF